MDLAEVLKSIPIRRKSVITKMINYRIILKSVDLFLT